MVKNTKVRLFEMMNRVAGMPLIKENSSRPNLPSWASSAVKDFTPLEDYEKEVPCATNVQEVERNLNPKGTEIADPIKWMQDKDAAIAAGTKQDVEHGGRLSPLMMANVRKGDYNINKDALKLSKDDKDKIKLPQDADFGKIDYDLKELGDILTTEPSPSQLLGQNGKMGKTNFYNITLPAWKGIFYDLDQKKFYVINVCDKADTCAKVCFAQMGNFIKNDPVIRLNAQKLNYLLNKADTWKGQIISGIKGLYDGVSLVVVRWHDSGDFFSEEYMKLAFEVAEQTKFAEHYAYTKEVGMAKSLKGIMPDNFEFKFSFGGKENNLIDMTKDPHAIIVPTRVFAKLQPDERKFNKKTQQWYIGKGWKFTGDTINMLKEKIVEFAKEEYGIDLDIRTLKMHEEMKSIPYDKSNKRVWNVIGVSGDSDIAALRRDVLGIYLLQHK
jgi:hypothetical protein